MGENDPENDRPQTCHMIEVINDGLPSWKRRGLQIETRISRALRNEFRFVEGKMSEKSTNFLSYSCKLDQKTLRAAKNKICLLNLTLKCLKSKNKKWNRSEARIHLPHIRSDGNAASRAK